MHGEKEHSNGAKLLKNSPSINAVRDNGSIAATIGIINGKVKIGLSDEDIKILANDKNVQKVSNHNMNLSVYNKKHMLSN